MPLIEQALSNKERVLRYEARNCLDMIKDHSNALYKDAGSGPDAPVFERRVCEFNLMVLKAAFEDYRAQHPEMEAPQTMDETPSVSVPTEMPQRLTGEAKSRPTNQPNHL